MHETVESGGPTHIVHHDVDAGSIQIVRRRLNDIGADQRAAAVVEPFHPWQGRLDVLNAILTRKLGHARKRKLDHQRMDRRQRRTNDRTVTAYRRHALRCQRYVGVQNDIGADDGIRLVVMADDRPGRLLRRGQNGMELPVLLDLVSLGE